MATGKFISGFFEDTTEITLGNNKNQNKEESICPPNSGSTHKTERKTKHVQVVLGEGRDEDWDKHLGLTMLILKTKQNLNSK